MKRIIVCLQQSEALLGGSGAQALRGQLDRYWRRAQMRALQIGFHHYIAEIFGLSLPKNIPLAALSALAIQAETAQQRWCAYLDPVHFVPDRDTLLMAPPQQLAISDDEAQQLTNDIAEFYQHEHWQLTCVTNSHWLLQLPDEPDLRLTSLADAQNENLFDVMPRGGDAKHWCKTLNEIQMFLFNHVVNQQRQRDAKPTINGVWLWGGGKLRTVTSPASSRRLHVYSDNSEIFGMAKLCQLSCQQVVNPLSILLEQADRDDEFLISVSFDAARLSNAATGISAALQQTYFEPLRQALTAGQLDEVVFFFDNGIELKLNRTLLRKVWRSW